MSRLNKAAGVLTALAVAAFTAACQDQAVPTATDAEADLSHSPSGAELYVAELTPLNNSGVSGAAAFVIHNGEFTARVFARGMVPNELHPQHIRGLDGNQNGVCPAPSAANRMPNMPEEAAEPDRFISVAEGQPDYGAIRVPLDSELVPIPAGEFPMANSDGIVNYLQRTSFDALQSALGDFALRPLDETVVVLHGGFVTGPDGQRVYVPSLPVACAQIRMTSRQEAEERQNNPTFEQIERLGNPLVSEALLSRRDPDLHSLFNRTDPRTDPELFRDDIIGFITGVAGRDPAYAAAVADVLVPDLLMVFPNRAPGVTAREVDDSPLVGWLTYVLAPGEGYGGRKLDNDDAVDKALGVVFGTALGNTNNVSPGLTTDNVPGEPDPNTFPYVSPPF